MKLLEAVRLSRQAVVGRPYQAVLACGFTPLHLETFLKAHLRLRLPDQELRIQTGLHGDLPGTIESAAGRVNDVLFAVVEWADLDRRLGLRQLGGWTPRDLADIETEVDRSVNRLAAALRRAAENTPVVLAMPALPLPPVSHYPSFQAGAFDLRLMERTARFARRLAEVAAIRVIHPRRLESVSDRHDVVSELASGFPYRMSYADRLAEEAVRLAVPPPVKKGLITDLDDTLWRGILGDDGLDGISWDLDNRSQMHGVYQQLLASLAAAGVLVAAASKNDGSLVESVFESRRDLLLRKRDLYPMEVHWGAKSESVSRILDVWNIGPDSVVFVDDSPMELAEVQAVHPKLECVLFPKRDPSAVYGLCHRLRDLFGKAELQEEDRLRAESIRSASALRHSFESSGASADDFLRDARAELSVSFRKSPADSRAFELVNKTNQFNLNGGRYGEREWRACLARETSVLLVASYSDKYGALGKIAVIAGRLSGRRLTIETWVMSCRAFSRRVEYKCLSELFREFGVKEIQLDYERTERNGPMGNFLAEISGREPDGTILITRREFEARCPPLYFQEGAANE